MPVSQHHRSQPSRVIEYRSYRTQKIHQQVKWKRDRDDLQKAVKLQDLVLQWKDGELSDELFDMEKEKLFPGTGLAARRMVLKNARERRDRIRKKLEGMGL